MFRINVLNQDGWTRVVLEDQQNGNKAEILGSGAVLNAFYLETPGGPFNLIDGYIDKEDFKNCITKGFRSAKLSPFVCRLDRSKYSWNGVEYTLDNRFVLNGSALHGILYDAVFDVIDTAENDSCCSVTLRYQYDGDLSGYPFPYNCTVKYTLGEEGKLTIHTHLSNPITAATSIPICDGWHPYFKLGGKVDDWWLEVASDQMLEYDSELIPTGKYVTNSSFYPRRRIGDLHLDNGFLLRENISPLCTLTNGHLAVEFISVKNYPYLQLYTPPNRDGLSIENLSAAPDAFNNGLGLTILEPGQKADFEVQMKFIRQSDEG
jgi:aldose 1-epimerase